VAAVDTDALSRTSDLSGKPIGDGEDRHVTVKLDDGTIRRLKVTGGEALDLRRAGHVPGGWWKRRWLWIKSHWVKGFFTVLTLLIASFVLPSVLKISDDRRQEFQAKVRLIRTVDEATSRNFSDANQAAKHFRRRTRDSIGQKVVDRWVGAEGTVDPQLGLLFPRDSQREVRNYWSGMREAQFDYATLSFCCKRSRRNDVRTVMSFIAAHPSPSSFKKQPDGTYLRNIPGANTSFSLVQRPRPSPWPDMFCGPPRGCTTARNFRDSYRLVGVMLLDTNPGLARAVMDARAAGFKRNLFD
jgi:hypothetical protein